MSSRIRSAPRSYSHENTQLCTNFTDPDPMLPATEPSVPIGGYPLRSRLAQLFDGFKN